MNDWDLLFVVIVVLIVVVNGTSFFFTAHNHIDVHLVLTSVTTTVITTYCFYEVIVCLIYHLVHHKSWSLNEAFLWRHNFRDWFNIRDIITLNWTWSSRQLSQRIDFFCPCFFLSKIAYKPCKFSKVPCACYIFFEKQNRLSVQ